MPRHPLWWILASISAVLSCQATHRPARPALAAAPTVGELRDATYAGIADHPVRLTRGQWEGEPFVAGGTSRPSVWLVRDFQLTGDLDHDGAEDTVVLLGTSSGGSGSVLYLAVVGRRGGTLAELGSVRVGDRVQVRAGHLDGNRIALDVVQAGPKDAACCPTQTATRMWQLGAGGLLELPSAITGTLSLADLAGPEWVLRGWSFDETTPAKPEVTLVYADGRVSGSAGCNRYSAAVTSGDQPGDLVVGPIAATRMACVAPADTIEHRYLAALEGVRRFGFLAGRLALTSTGGGTAPLLLFAPRPPAAGR